MRAVLFRTRPLGTNVLQYSRVRILGQFHEARQRRHAGNGPAGGPAPTPGQVGFDDPAEEHSPRNDQAGWRPTLLKMFESSLTTFVSVAVLGLVGYSYTRYYKHLVLQKMENAFKPGDPVLALADAKSPGHQDCSSRDQWFVRSEQNRIDAIVNGSEKGHYYLIVGEKGTGKSSMLIEAMRRVNGEGVSMFDAHADLEIFRIRLGRALDFEYHEDNIGSLFSIRGPRDASALLDIERAFNKLEKVALERRRITGTPLVLIINSTHLLRDDEDGRDLLELIQQRAEQWAAGSLVTVVMNSDDYWVYERLKLQATRLEVFPVLDLSKDKSLAALRSYRLHYFKEIPSDDIIKEVYEMVGGRPQFLSRVARSPDMIESCREICAKEKTWFLNQCWILGEAMDDDVMDQQKYASAAMVLAKALVEKENAMEKIYDPDRGHILPQIPLHEARQIMTRADFIQSYDHINIFTIDPKAMVRADSVPMQRAFREICAEPGFDNHLEATLDRISAIESLGRTREITLKDLWNKGRYAIQTKNAKGQVLSETAFETVVVKEDDEKVDAED